MLLRTQIVGVEFYDAVLNNELQLLKRLVTQHKIDLNAKFIEVRKKNHADLCPIHLASYRGYTYMLQYLIESKCDVNQTTTTLRRTALHFAVLRHKMACMLLLIAAGAQLDAKDTFSNSPCHYAADDGYCQMLDVLIRRGVNVDTLDITSKTPLMKAVRNNKTDAVLRLLRAQCNINITDRNSDMALHYAARNGCADVLDILISAGSLIDVQNYWGRTPLMETVCYNHKDAVARLLKASCDLNRREFKTGDTALHIAIKRNYTEVVGLLLAAGSRHDIYNHQGETAAYDAVVSNKVEIIRLMVIHNCDLEQPGKYFSDGVYKSLFQIAAEKGHFDICRLLASFGYVDFRARGYIYMNYIPPRLVTEQEDVVQWLRRKMQTPTSLQLLCRKCIRKRLGHKIVHTVECLPIPRALKEFVLIKDMDEEEEKNLR
ncbi:serine/threonine-protein phosphatase 6 regulatory ankyrin repeat subunit B-like [Pecten maximus]|uniref:serine/threonine-protein phosphatase 6 regulatory ankyrin repeat subunit B-like n=1 Tax=Pecten maximus TaxID=6579 RepID=UPI00145895A7|nr:serine/threonine-protein phosphatase 6 regulatory ankyrin repeat subunit B-like [Pecten maximus]